MSLWTHKVPTLFDINALFPCLLFFFRRWWMSWTPTLSFCEASCPCTWTAWEWSCSLTARCTSFYGDSKTLSSQRSKPWSPKWTNILGLCGRWGLLNGVFTSYFTPVSLCDFWRSFLRLKSFRNLNVTGLSRLLKHQTTGSLHYRYKKWDWPHADEGWFYFLLHFKESQDSRLLMLTHTCTNNTCKCNLCLLLPVSSAPCCHVLSVRVKHSGILMSVKFLNWSFGSVE